jgi:RNA polymerase sigma factor (sigma-70 family)
MDSRIAALIAQPGPSGVLSANVADVRTQLATLHASSFAWAMYCCQRRRPDAEDLLHDVYVSVLENGRRYDGRSSFKTWLFGVIARTARSRNRRDRLRALLDVTRAFRIDIPRASMPPDDAAVNGDRRDRTRRALDELSPRQRDVLLLVFYHDLTIEEAATVMHVSLGSARVHYQRGKQRLASLLAQDRP